MKTPLLTLAIVALAMGATQVLAKPAQTIKAAQPIKAADKCPAFAITAEPARKGTKVLAFTVKPAPDAAGPYSWMTNAGYISSGQGSPSVLVDVSAAPADLKTITAELLVEGVPKTCPETSRSLSATAPVP